VPRRTSWFLVLLATGSLLTLFFAYPFERLLFAPLALLIGVATFLAPPVGLALFLLSTLSTLQLPILLESPFFSGAEPGFLAMTAAVALRNLIRPRRLDLPSPLVALLLLHAGAVLASSLLLWISFRELPGDWHATLTADALSKIYFWRWGNPFHFMRMALLLLEGLAAFLVALHAFRSNPRRTLLYVVAAFSVLGGLLAAYSAVELLFRGKEITWYPGFGPVFADRNAYAAFWVILVPFGLALALQSKGIARAGGALLAAASWLFCGLSLSVTGIGAIVFSTGAYLALRPRRRGSGTLKWLAAGLLVGMVALGSAAWFLTRDTQLVRLMEARAGERVSFWAPAAAMVGDHPLLGLGPGEFYRRLPEYRARLSDLPASAYEQENVHNYYLQLAVGTGLMGALPFLLIAAYLLRAGWLRLGNPLPGDADIPGPSAARRNPLGFLELSRSDCLALLLAALAGLLVLSIAQHPMLRFPFQAAYWIFAGLIAGLSLRPNPERLGRTTLLPPVGIVFLAFVCQSLFFPHPRLDDFRYGFHQSEEEEGVLLTEGVAFLRTEWDRGMAAFELRAGPGSPAQSVEIHLNGERTRIEVRADQWSVYEGSIDRAGMVDLGIRTRPVLPRAFPNSWGAGVRVRGLPVFGSDP
jgi:O-antigen ligase